MALNRTVNKANTHKVAGNSFTFTNLSSQPTESVNEAEILLSLEFDKDIESIITQPDTFTNTTGEAGWRQYTPDARIDYHDKPFVYGEFKSFEDSLRECVKKAFELHKRIVKAQTGRELVMFTNEGLTPLKVAQFRQLKTYLRYEPLPDVDAAVLAHLNAKRIVALSTVDDIVLEMNAPSQYAMALLAHQVLRTKTIEPIKRRTLVEIAQ